MVKSFSEFLNEERIQSFEYWEKVLASDKYALKVLDTIRQNGGYASERQMAILRRAERGDKTPYSPRN
jgi:hypothetical protein